MKKVLTRIAIAIITLFIIALSINGYVCLSTKNQIDPKLNKNDHYDAILILGAGVWGNNPSPLLRDRLNTGIDLYKKGYAPKILMSGDHGQVNYDEVNIMKEYAIDQDVPSEDIFMDHAGFSTYESIYRAKKIFQTKKILIVTQKYHLYRALYISNKFDLEADGIDTKRTYNDQFRRDIREVLARNKDFFNCITKPKPKYLGDPIPITGNGDQTNDK